MTLVGEAENIVSGFCQSLLNSNHRNSRLGLMPSSRQRWYRHHLQPANERFLRSSKKEKPPTSADGAARLLHAASLEPPVRVPRHDCSAEEGRARPAALEAPVHPLQRAAAHLEHISLSPSSKTYPTQSLTMTCNEKRRRKVSRVANLAALLLVGEADDRRGRLGRHFSRVSKRKGIEL